MEIPTAQVHPETHSSNEVWEQKIFEADKTRKIIKILEAIVAYMQNNPLITFQKMETRLREKHCYTYLIARKRDPSLQGFTFEWPSGTTKTYRLFLSTQDEGNALQEVIEESTSYEQNFQKLNDTGVLIPPNFP